MNLKQFNKVATFKTVVVCFLFIAVALGTAILTLNVMGFRVNGILLLAHLLEISAPFCSAARSVHLYRSGLMTFGAQTVSSPIFPRSGLQPL